MRLTKTLLLAAALLCCFGQLRSQDLHNTLFYMNPLHMNPAFSGAFEGTYRIGGIYRDQGRTVVTNAYSTPTLYIDAPILMIGKRHWIGVGLLMFQDQAGDGKLRVSAGQLSGAFHASLDKKSKNVLTLGVQYGRVGRSLKDLARLNFDDEIRNKMPTTDAVVGGGTEPKTDFTDINAGLLLKSKVNKTTDFNAGFSVRHLTSPASDYNFGSSTVDFNMRFIAHAQLNTALNDKITLTPEIYYSSLSPASQFQAHAWAGYILKPDVKLNGGLGYRVGDSAQLLIGIDYKDFKAALGYDFTLSDLADANSRQGGFEIAVNYIGKIYKKPKVKPVILCPHL